ncbi:MAG TPA: hypothetical protein VNT01_06030 [Symbiobacteriaceae bacterium]|nr:hypothetical protein [Symbiobacteriaceae bacterium]
MITLTEASLVEFYPLHIGEPENDQQVVGRADTGEFIALPVEGVALIRWFQDGLAAGEVKRRFTSQFGQAPDLDEFVEGLADCGFVRRVDGWNHVPPHSVTVRPQGWQLFGGIPAGRLAWLFSIPMRLLYLSIWVAVPGLLIARPGLIPSAGDAWVHPRVMVNALILMMATWALIFLHELAHLLAVRARGCSGYLAVSHRLHYLVAQVEMSSVRTLPRAVRYGPYLAGMTWDMAVLLACLLLRIFGVGGAVPGLVAYVVALSLVFQFGFFMRTDVYYLFVNWLDLGNLMADTQHWLVNLFMRLLGRRPPHDLSAVPVRELRIVRWYAGFYLLGVVIVVGQFILLGLPLAVRFAAQAGASLGRGPATVDFWDGLLFFALAGANFGTVAFVAWRERRRRREVE